MIQKICVTDFMLYLRQLVSNVVFVNQNVFIGEI